MGKKKGHILGHALSRDSQGRTLVRAVYRGSRWKEGKKVLRGFLRTLGIKGSWGVLRSGKTEVTLRVTRTREVQL